MYVKEVTVENQVGLHARPATFFIQKANEYKSSIWVSLAAPPSASLLMVPMSRLLLMAWSSWSAPALLSNPFSKISGGATRRFFCTANL